MDLSTSTIRIRIELWTDRARVARSQQQSFLAAANAYGEQPTPYSDPWFSDYRRALVNAEQTKADAAGQYAEQAEAVVADLRDRLAVADHHAGAVPA